MTRSLGCASHGTNDSTIKFEPGRSGVLGYTHMEQRRSEIFVREDQTDGHLELLMDLSSG